jgi:protein SCO1/2
MKSILWNTEYFLVFSSSFQYHFILIFYTLKPTKTLPIFNPSDVNPELVDSTVQYISKYHTIDFSFVNQTENITQKIMKARFM